MVAAIDTLSTGIDPPRDRINRTSDGKPSSCTAIACGHHHEVALELVEVADYSSARRSSSGNLRMQPSPGSDVVKVGRARQSDATVHKVRMRVPEDQGMSVIVLVTKIVYE